MSKQKSARTALPLFMTVVLTIVAPPPGQTAENAPWFGVTPAPGFEPDIAPHHGLGGAAPRDQL